MFWDHESIVIKIGKICLNHKQSEINLIIPVGKMFI